MLWSGDDLLGGHERIPGDTIEQGQKGKLQKFLEKNIGELSITDFSLHSIGVILFRYHKKELLDDFIKDVMPKVDLLSLPLRNYPDLLD